VRVLNSLQEFFVILDGNDDRNGFAFARNNLRFGQCAFHALYYMSPDTDHKLNKLPRRVNVIAEPAESYNLESTMTLAQRFSIVIRFPKLRRSFLFIERNGSRSLSLFFSSLDEGVRAL
jgi:hypothetical protein